MLPSAERVFAHGKGRGDTLGSRLHRGKKGWTIFSQKKRDTRGIHNEREDS